VKSPGADVTWHKGAKRQMANIDRFLEELQTFDEREIAESTIRQLEEIVKKIDTYEMREEDENVSTTNLNAPYSQALSTLEEWIKGVLQYHLLMIKRIKPLSMKCEEIEKEVKEADQKLGLLNRKSEVCFLIFNAI
jgi:dynein heavy chain